VLRNENSKNITKKENALKEEEQIKWKRKDSSGDGRGARHS